VTSDLLVTCVILVLRELVLPENWSGYHGTVQDWSGYYGILFRTGLVIMVLFRTGLVFSEYDSVPTSY